MMNEFEEAVQTTFAELRAMSREELSAEIEKRKNSDFSRIFFETGESSDEKHFSPPIKDSPVFEEKLEELLNKIVEKQLKKFLPVVVEEVLLRISGERVERSMV